MCTYYLRGRYYYARSKVSRRLPSSASRGIPRVSRDHFITVIPTRFVSLSVHFSRLHTHYIVLVVIGRNSARRVRDRSTYRVTSSNVFVITVGLSEVSARFKSLTRIRNRRFALRIYEVTAAAAPPSPPSRSFSPLSTRSIRPVVLPSTYHRPGADITRVLYKRSNDRPPNDSPESFSGRPSERRRTVLHARTFRL